MSRTVTSPPASSDQSGSTPPSSGVPGLNAPRLNSLCSAKYDYLLNDMNQYPCFVGERLIQLCPRVQPYLLKKLDLSTDQDHYSPPLPDQASECICSLPVYNLIQMCASCQTGPGRSTLFDYWTINCAPGLNTTTFPYAVPADTQIPAWAYDTVNSSTPVKFFFRNATKSISPSPVFTPTTASTEALLPTATVFENLAPPPSNEAMKQHRIIVVTSTLSALLTVVLVVIAVLWARNKRIYAKQGTRLESSSQLDVNTSFDDKGSFHRSQHQFYDPSHDLFTTASSGSFMTNSSSSRSSVLSSSYCSSSSDADATDRYPISLSSEGHGRTKGQSRFSDSASSDNDDDRGGEGADLLSLTESDLEGGAGAAVGHGHHHLSPFSDRHRSSMESHHRMVSAHVATRNNVQNRQDNRNAQRSDETVSLRSASSTGAVYGGGGGYGRVDERLLMEIDLSDLEED